MRLAQRVGLPIPTVSIPQRQRPLCMIERYDRVLSPQVRLERLHQEDFRQALGIPPDHKHEIECGPSLQQCFGLLRDTSIQPVADLQALPRCRDLHLSTI